MCDIQIDIIPLHYAGEELFGQGLWSQLLKEYTYKHYVCIYNVIYKYLTILNNWIIQLDMYTDLILWIILCVLLYYIDRHMYKMINITICYV